MQKSNTSLTSQITQVATENKFAYFISVVALIFLLLGVFGSVRTTINFLAFAKYPNGGVLSFNSNFMQKEEDCIYPQSFSTPALFYDTSGNVRQPSLEEQKTTEAQKEEEKRMADEQKQTCLNSVAVARETAKVNDISISLFYLFLGVGIMVGKRFLK